jgi:tetratricopeptide (TPR) repeat protein
VRRKAGALVLLATAFARADEGPWAVPDVSGPALFVKLQANPSRAYIVTPSDKVAPEADGDERVELPLSPEEKEALGRCRALVDAGDHADALARLDALLKENPANHDARMLVGLALHAQGDPKAALAALRESIIGNRRNPEAWTALEQVARKLGKRVVRPRLKMKGWIAPKEDGSIVVGYAEATRDSDVPWFYYALARGYYRYEDGFKRDHPDAKEYAFTFRELLFGFGTALNAAEGLKAAKRSPEFKLLIAEKKAKTLVPFLFFAAYPEPVPQRPERGFEQLKPVLERYFDTKIVR